MRMIKLLAGVLFLATIASVFAWAFFDLVWWTPAVNDPNRGAFICLFHAFGLFAGCWLVVNSDN